MPNDASVWLKLSHTSKFVTLAASALPAMVKLPPGITISGEHIGVDLRRLLAERRLDSWLAYVTDLRLSTREGAVVSTSTRRSASRQPPPASTRFRHLAALGAIARTALSILLRRVSR